MDRAELVEELAQVLGVSRKDAKTVLEAILDGMIHALRNGERVEIRRFGTLSTHVRPPRRGRNPQSGEPITVPSKRIPDFRAAAELKALVNRLAEAHTCCGQQTQFRKRQRRPAMDPGGRRVFALNKEI